MAAFLVEARQVAAFLVEDRQVADFKKRVGGQFICIEERRVADILVE